VVLGECGPVLVGQLHELQQENIVSFYEEDGFPADRFLQIQSECILGPGETECITLAEHVSGAICCDDGKGRRVGSDILGAAHVTGSIGLLRNLVACGECSAGEAYAAYLLMIEGGGFLPRLEPEFFEPT